jgi:uncharacterized damage-inducible protein DinB
MAVSSRASCTWPAGVLETALHAKRLSEGTFAALRPEESNPMSYLHQVSRLATGAALSILLAGFASPSRGPAASQPQDGGQKKDASKAMATESQIVLAQWNEIGRKLIAIAEDLPEDKYDYKPNPDSRTFVGQLLHASASMYYFTDAAQGQKVRYPDDPSRENLKSKSDVVAFVKKSVEDGAAVIKSKGDKGMSEIFTDPESKQQMHISDLAYSLMEHSGEHYGQLVVYYRINGLVPPESRKK